MICYTCPECHQQVCVARREELPTRPFCSARCQQIDLGKWLTGEYVISDPLPGAALPEVDEAPEEDGGA